MTNMHYIGFDIHKKTIAFCEKTVDGSCDSPKLTS